MTTTPEAPLPPILFPATALLPAPPPPLPVFAVAFCPVVVVEFPSVEAAKTFYASAGSSTVNSTFPNLVIDNESAGHTVNLATGGLLGLTVTIAPATGTP